MRQVKISNTKFNKMDKEKNLVVQIFGNKEIDELDFETREELPGWTDEDGKTVYCKHEIELDKDGNPFKSYRTARGEWVSIKRIEELLNSFKKTGATHIAMEHHCDHFGYMFDYGVLRVATEEDDVAYEITLEKNQKNQNQQRIKELEAEIVKLKAE